MKAAIIVDSTAGLSDELRARDDIYQVDLSLNFKDGETMVDSTEADQVAYFYDKLSRVSELPTTSQPKPGDYIAIFDDIVSKDYDVVFMFLMSSLLSGTFQTGQMVAADYQDQITIHCIDTKGVSVYSEHIVLEALRMIESGMEEEAILDEIQWVTDHSTIYVAIKDLNNLVKGGRMKAMQAMLGNMLKIMPILNFTNEGGLAVYDKVRSLKKVKKTYRDLFNQAYDQYNGHVALAFAHGDAETEIEQLRDDVIADHPDMPSVIKYLTPVVGTHGGKGCLGMATLAKARIEG
ncbi:DegV family protein [Aerococcus kribbianus]|uniref:DegV family protein n=1 Tax=Aerococcus kribbianus TaxID=2999064 RepID=A0A9X3FW25_9LACT|nr:MULTISPECIES: DegV family protein [unclassified Aerococcus]MCZ0717284.1 DegV family protein [Aerococcus sp. YH-aer221]MCZ0725572.1 DegV family protein [Aerococcus sp. YH-aer222]